MGARRRRLGRRRCRTPSAPPPKNKASLRTEGLAAARRSASARPTRGWRASERPAHRRSQDAGFLGFDAVERLDHRRLPGSRRGRRARGRQRRRRSTADAGDCRRRTRCTRPRCRSSSPSVWVEVDRRPRPRARRCSRIRDERARHVGVDGRRPRPRRGPDHGVLALSDLFVSAARSSATTATGRRHHPLPAPATRDPRVSARGRGRAVAAARLGRGRRRRRVAGLRARRAARRGDAAHRSGRVLIVSLPDTSSGPTSSRRRRPNLDRLFAQSAIGGDGHQRRRPADPVAERLRDLRRRCTRAIGNGADRQARASASTRTSAATAPVSCSPPAPGIPPGDGLVYMPITDTIETNDERALRRRGRSASVTSWRRRASRAR